MKRTRWIPLIVYAALLVAFLGWISNLFTTSQDTLPYSKVVELFNKEQVRQFVVQDQTITMQLNKPYNGQTTITHRWPTRRASGRRCTRLLRSRRPPACWKTTILFRTRAFRPIP